MPTQIVNRILEDIKHAMKAQDKEKLLALRTLHSDMKNVAINEKRELNDEVAALVLARSVKSLAEAIEQFKAGGREDIVAKETARLNLYKGYQPQQMGEAAIEALVEKVIKETGAAGKKDIGLVMKALMPQVKGMADGKLVNSMVMRKLP